MVTLPHGVDETPRWHNNYLNNQLRVLPLFTLAPFTAWCLDAGVAVPLRFNRRIKQMNLRNKYTEADNVISYFILKYDKFL
jgi:hypothetical protein